MVQSRFVSYIYRYGKNDIKEQNTGFIKVQRISRENLRCRIHINVRDMARTGQVHCNIYLFGRKENHGWFRSLLGECLICSGLGELELDTAWDHVTEDDVSMEDCHGVILSCDDGAIYASDWQEDSVEPAKILILSQSMPVQEKETALSDGGNAVRPELPEESKPRKETAPETDRMQEETASEEDKPQKETAPETGRMQEEAEPDKQQKEMTQIDDRAVAENSETQENERENRPAEEAENEWTAEAVSQAAAEQEAAAGKTDYCRALLDSCQKLDTIDDSRILECVKIEPQDIGKMAMSNWSLGTNSFLSHGHYNYKHLMLGRIQFGKMQERYVLGVPGVYTNKEKYLANMFGFHVFIPARTTRVLTGCFGYWVVEVKN